MTYEGTDFAQGPPKCPHFGQELISLELKHISYPAGRCSYPGLWCTPRKHFGSLNFGKEPPKSFVTFNNSKKFGKMKDIMLQNVVVILIEQDCGTFRENLWRV